MTKVICPKILDCNIKYGSEPPSQGHCIVHEKSGLCEANCGTDTDGPSHCLELNLAIDIIAKKQKITRDVVISKIVAMRMKP